MRNMTRVRDFSMATAMLTLAFTLCCTEGKAASYKEDKVGKAGPFTIIRIFDDGKFSRCAATMGPNKSMLRIAWTKNHVYSISVPGVKNVNPLIMSIEMPSGTLSFDAVTNGKRSWAPIDQTSIESFMDIRGKVAISVGESNFAWKIGKISMVDVLVAVENCVHSAK